MRIVVNTVVALAIMCGGASLVATASADDGRCRVADCSAGYSRLDR